jgi:transcriptional regulator with XRE-family HTH domain
VRKYISVCRNYNSLYVNGMIGAVKKNQPARNGDAEQWRKRLRQALDDRGLDYDEVSVAAECNAEYVSKMLAGRFNPTVARLMKICEASHIDMAYLFSEEPGPGDRNIIDQTADLSEQDADLVNRLIQSARAK